MRQVIALALKDLRLMPRNKGGLFFTFVWPIIVTVLFGFAFGGTGNNGEQGKVKIALVDEDGTDGSRLFAKKLEESFELTSMTRDDAANAVRRGTRTGYIVLTKGFGAASERMFYGDSRQVEIGVDPARLAESAMIEGILMKHASGDVQKMFTATPQSRLMAGQQGGEWQPLKVVKNDVSRVRSGPANSFDITFPQGVIWGLIGCMMSFGISMVTERTHGTLVRLRMAPLTRAQILGGKALSCFLSIMFVELMLLGVALGLGVRPVSMPMLALAGVCAAICFVGFMMLVATLGKTEQAASGAAWAILMPLSMFGGAMIPTFIMPAWMQTIGQVSPIRWTLLAIEGGVWRNFSLAEMVLPCAILISFGIVCFALGTRGLKEA